MAQNLTFWRNGTPVPVLGGKYTQWQGTTQARATCSACGWEGSLFSTRQVEAYRVVGEREFDAHKCLTACAECKVPAGRPCKPWCPVGGNAHDDI